MNKFLFDVDKDLHIGIKRLKSRLGFEEDRGIIVTAVCGDKNGVFPVINFTSTDFISDTIILIPIKSSEAYIKDFEKMKSLSLFEGNRTKLMSIFYDILHRLYCDNVESPGILNPASLISSKDKSINNNSRTLGNGTFTLAALIAYKR